MDIYFLTWLHTPRLKGLSRKACIKDTLNLDGNAYIM